MPSVTTPTLRGIIIRDETDKVIVQASPQDIQRFAPRQGQEVQVRPEAPRVRVRAQDRPGPVHYGHRYLYGGVTAWASPTFVGEDDPVAVPPVGRLRPNDYLYDRQGRPVAQMVDVQVHVDRIETTALGETVRHYYAGEPEITITARGLPGVTLLG